MGLLDRSGQRRARYLEQDANVYHKGKHVSPI